MEHSNMIMLTQSTNLTMANGKWPQQQSESLGPTKTLVEQTRVVLKSTTPTRSSPGEKASADLANVKKDGQRITATTFGVEIELILAFQQELLQQILKDNNINANIVKDIPERHHYTLLGNDLPDAQQSLAHRIRDRYPSWVLEVPIDDVTFRRSRMVLLRAPSPTFGRYLRPYLMEPLLLARKIFSNAGLKCKVIGAVEPTPVALERSTIHCPGNDKTVCLMDSLVDYTGWTLTDDHTLTGALPSQLAATLAYRGIKDSGSWDSHGIELVSPVFDLDKKVSAISQVDKFSSCAKGAGSWDILDSIWTGVHVHIGFNFSKPEDIPVRLFQHIAYILTLHEDLISKCQPRSRCGINTKTEEQVTEEFPDTYSDFDPDELLEDLPTPPEPTAEELEAENESKVRQYELEYTGYENVSSNARYMASSNGLSYPMSAETVRNLIFQKNGTALDLIRQMQKPLDEQDPTGFRHRGYMVNWCNIENLIRNETTWKPIKPTIEFRQHACVNDAQTIKHWVVFLEAIMKLAEEMAHQDIDQSVDYADSEAAKYTLGRSGIWPCTSITTFCVDFLGLDRGKAAYWHGRYDGYENDRP